MIAPLADSRLQLTALRAAANCRSFRSDKVVMAMRKGNGVPFLVVGLAFLILGVSGRRAFLTIGLAFLVLGMVLMARQRTDA